MEMDFYPFHIKPLTKLLIDWDKPCPGLPLKINLGTNTNIH